MFCPICGAYNVDTEKKCFHCKMRFNTQNNSVRQDTPSKKKWFGARILDELKQTREYYASIESLKEKPKGNKKHYFRNKSEIWLELANEYAETVNSTIDISDFFLTYDSLVSTLEDLIQAERYITFENKQPSQQLEEILNIKHLAIKDLLERIRIKTESNTLLTSDKIKAYDLMLNMLDIYAEETPNEAKSYINSFNHDVVMPLREKEAVEVARKEKIEAAKREKLAVQQKKLYDLNSLENGYEFEEYIARILRVNGFTSISITPKSGDYGIDVLAEKDGIKHAIQCKLYSNSVGPGAVQEASTGKAFYNAHVAIVATNSTFTSSAKNMADKVGVVLWDRDKIIGMDKAISTQSESNVIIPPVQFQKDVVSESDELYLQAVEYVIEMGQASTSVLQRRLKLSYAHATRLLYLMEHNGIVGPFEGSKPRHVFVSKEQWDKMK